jgi:hypothetical protein
MSPIHEHEIHHETPARQYETPLRTLLEVLPIPLLVGIAVAWPLAFRSPPPWWILLGGGLYGGLSAWVVAIAWRDGRARSN